MYADCIEAGGRLPPGAQMRRDKYTSRNPLPVTVVSGQCQVDVRRANMDSENSPDDFGLFYVPDAFRNMAGWVIRQCVSPSAIGGFGTVQLDNMIGHLTNSSNPLDGLQTEEFPPSSTFYTVTVSKPTGDTVHEPGYYDPSIAQVLSDAAQRAGEALPRNNVMAQRFKTEADMLAGQADAMSRGSIVPWWSYSLAVLEDQMTYACDAKLGTPKSADCTALEYSELGPDSDTVTIGPEVLKFLSSKTCNVAISAAVTVTLTWAQIKAALATLINFCVLHPLIPSKGGRAFAKTLSGRGMEVKRGIVDGLNALPQHVNIALFEQHEPIPANPLNEIKTCTWQQVMNGGDTMTCS